MLWSWMVGLAASLYGTSPERAGTWDAPKAAATGLGSRSDSNRRTGTDTAIGHRPFLFHETAAWRTHRVAVQSTGYSARDPSSEGCRLSTTPGALNNFRGATMDIRRTIIGALLAIGATAIP